MEKAECQVDLVNLEIPVTRVRVAILIVTFLAMKMNLHAPTMTQVLGVDGVAKDGEPGNSGSVGVGDTRRGDDGDDGQFEFIGSS